MQTLKTWLVGAALGATTIVATPHIAHACGGCFVPPAEDSQVTGHRMILSVSMDQTTLYDQIVYSGNPEEFAWVLPIRGQVEVGISSDLLFNQLGQTTAVQVVPPPLNCPFYEPCRSFGDDFDTQSAPSAGEGPDSGVEVLVEEAVGPFETVQLSATDPAALNRWLSDNDYDIPSDIQPVIDAYQREGFNFLALKLAPGEGVDRMAPVRITTPGAAPGLPLRMVAAGTGATTTMTLWVIGEGRYEPSNFDSFLLGADDVTWNWDTNDSDYTEVRAARITDSQGSAWQMEASVIEQPANFRNQVEQVVSIFSPEEHGYFPTDDQDEFELMREDLEVLFFGMNESDVKVTRLRAELSRPALATDLELRASADQSEVSPFLQLTQSTGTMPACPPPPDCGGEGLGFGNDSDDSLSSSGALCSAPSAPAEDDALATGLLLALALGLVRRRRG